MIWTLFNNFVVVYLETNIYSQYLRKCIFQDAQDQDQENRTEEDVINDDFPVLEDYDNIDDLKVFYLIIYSIYSYTITMVQFKINEE